ncbi:hypothetical protein B0H19DRAFT_1084664 [Mycena capillaripes]|nr:hypothetical protein B0H19DRAFT_1084664 [Mycena capillaripes]
MWALNILALLNYKEHESLPKNSFTSSSLPLTSQSSFSTLPSFLTLCTTTKFSTTLFNFLAAAVLLSTTTDAEFVIGRVTFNYQAPGHYLFGRSAIDIFKLVFHERRRTGQNFAQAHPKNGGDFGNFVRTGPGFSAANPQFLSRQDLGFEAKISNFCPAVVQASQGTIRGPNDP